MCIVQFKHYKKYIVIKDKRTISNLNQKIAQKDDDFNFCLEMATLQILNMELLFRDLFALHDRFKELGMVIKNGEVHLPDLEECDV